MTNYQKLLDEWNKLLLLYRLQEKQLKELRGEESLEEAKADMVRGCLTLLRGGKK